MSDDLFMVQWLMPDQCWPAHPINCPERVDELTEQFRDCGWGRDHDVLVGYSTYDGKMWGIQLLVGGHRWEAALRAKIRIPVVMVPEETIEEAWGGDLNLWRTIMNLGRGQRGVR